MNESEQKELWLMLGEMRSDLKTLVNERTHTNARLDSHITTTDARLKALEGYRTKIAAYTGLLGVGVPTAITVFLKQMGLL